MYPIVFYKGYSAFLYYFQRVINYKNNFMKSDLSSHLSIIDKLAPNVNEFLRTTTEDFQTNYSSANYLVEYIFNKYEVIAFFFRVENDEIILVALKEYAEFRP